MKNSVRKPIFIEFVGLPGAGKSSNIEKLEVLLKSRGFVVSSNNDFLKLNRYEKHLYPLLYAITDFHILKGVPVIIFLFFKINFSSSFERKDYYMLVKNFLVKRYILRSKSCDIFTWEGEFHILTSLSIKKLSEQQLKRVLGVFLTKNISIIVSFKTKINICIKRAYNDLQTKRKRERLFKRDKIELYNFYNLMEVNQIRINKILNEFENVSILEVGGEEYPEKNIESIYNTICNTI